ncbi:MAG: hypothetical protein QOG23_1369 [Blastocatellia bacterium]|jgi:hypothetical protein|nr:hypothetical protein [Blastocatellia bacterium]
MNHNQNNKFDLDRFLKSLLTPVRPKEDTLAKEKRRRFIDAIEELGKASSKDKK